jgi:hypothetical protein
LLRTAFKPSLRPDRDAGPIRLVKGIALTFEWSGVSATMAADRDGGLPAGSGSLLLTTDYRARWCLHPTPTAGEIEQTELSIVTRFEQRRSADYYTKYYIKSRSESLARSIAHG